MAYLMASLSWQLAQRYRKSRNSNAFIRFIAASSTIGIGLGGRYSYSGLVSDEWL